MKRILLLVSTLFAFAAYAQDFNHYVADPNGEPREHQVDVTHMLLDVSFKPEKGEVIGRVEHSFTPLRSAVDTIFWDGPGITFKKVVLVTDGRETEVQFDVTPKGIVTRFSPPLSWDKSYKMVFEYTATPSKGIYFIGWNTPEATDQRNQTRRQIWTQGQGIDHRHWIPMYDDMNDKFVTETITRFDSKYKVLSNGKLIKKMKNKDETTTWHYKMPGQHAGYLLMLGVGDYDVKESRTSRGTPVQFWYYPEHEDKKDLTSLYTEKIIEFLEDETGVAYPWGAYSQIMVQDFMYGAMENTSATIFGDFFNVDEYSFNDRSYVSVNAHELTHQWFGDLITARSGTGTWLQESFATYYAKLFMASVYGEDDYSMSRRNEVKSALAASKKDNFPIVHTRAGSSRVYQKGSRVLGMLRYVIGGEEFKRVVNYYVDKHAYGNVVTRDFELAIQDVTGRSMGWFFDQWLYRGGEPAYDVSYENYGNKTVMNITQSQAKSMTTGLFRMPINCGVYFTDGSKVETTKWVSSQTEQVVFDHESDKEIAYVLFDIGSQVMKSVTFEKTTEELIAQLENAQYMIDRYDALVALKQVDIEAKRSALQAAFERESHRMIKAEIVRQLAKDSKSNFFLITKLPKEDVRVKRALVSDCKNVNVYKSVFESALSDKSYTNIESSLRCLCEAGGENVDAYFERTRNIIGQGHNVRITWLSYKVDQLKSDSSQLIRDKSSNYYRYLNELTRYTSNQYEFRTRLNAMQAIKKFNYLNVQAIVSLMDASLSRNRRLAGPARQILTWYNEQYQMKKAIQQVFNQSKFSEADKKRLRQMKIVE